jgi:flagellar motor switch protein FliN
VSGSVGGASIETIRIFIDDLRKDLAEEISAAGALGITITRSEGPGESDVLPEDLIWWTGSRGGELRWTLFVGGNSGAWEAFGFGGETGTPAEDASARLGRCVERTLERKFGKSKVEGVFGWAEPPTNTGGKIVLSILRESTTSLQLHCCFSPELENALCRDDSGDSGAALVGSRSHQPAVEGSSMSLDVLMDIEIPVRVSFGKTKVRMGELLTMGSGAVIELDQELGDHVDVLVNNCVIARGEVVAVDGNYGVRIIAATSVTGKFLEGTK